MQICIEEFKKTTGIDISQRSKPLMRLRRACQKAKMLLSEAIIDEIEVDCLADGEDFEMEISRE